MKKLYDDGKIELPTVCPRGAEPWLFNVMLGLLHPDPQQRTTIEQLYYALAGDAEQAPIEIVESTPIRLEPFTECSYSGRDEMIDEVFEECGEDKSVFALACNILDRYHTSSPRGGSQGSPVRSAVVLAQATIKPTWYKVER